MIKLSKLMTLVVFVLLFGCSEDNKNSVNAQNDAMTDGSANSTSISIDQTQALEKARAVEYEIQKRFDEQRQVIDRPID